jgi:hypothetical protein
MGDVPLSLDVPAPSQAVLPRPPDARKLAGLGPDSGVVGSYEPDAEHSSIRPLDTKITVEQRAQLGKEGAAMIEAAVKAMDIKGVIQALREEDKYVHDVILPRYGDTLPK